MTTQEQQISDDLVAAAQHEAGHAVAAVILNIGIKQVSIAPFIEKITQQGVREHDGFVGLDNPLIGKNLEQLAPADILAAEKMIVVHLAGYYAELPFARRKKEVKSGAIDDIKNATAMSSLLAEQAGATADVRTYFKRGLLRAEELASICEAPIISVARALLVAPYCLNCEQVLAIIAQHDIAGLQKQLAEEW